MRTLPAFLRFLLLLPLAAALAACGSQGNEPSRADGPTRIVATTGMIGDMVREIAGERAEVTALVGTGVDPHTYRPTRRDVTALREADLVFYNGLHLEGQMGDILGRLKDGRPVHAVAELLGEEDLLLEDGAHDPHVWMDVALWSRLLDPMTEILSAYAPEHAEEFRRNAEEYRQELAGLDRYVRTVVATIPEEARVMITAHDAFNYFGRAYDMEVMGIQGISTESEAGLQDINRLVDLIVRREIPAVFVETSVAEKNVRALVEGARSRGHNLRIGGMLFSDAMGPPGTYEGTYIGMIDHNATTIVRALGGNAPEGGMMERLTIASR